MGARSKAVPHRIQFIDDEEILSVSISGSVELAEHMEVRREALRLCEKRGIGKILVDLEDLTGSMETLEAYDFGSTFRDDGAPVNVILAVLLPSDPRIRKDVQFITTVARNRGLQIDGFDNRDKAQDWLRSFEKSSG
jgi:hypothetical protein